MAERKEGAPRVAASSYLNSVPLIWSFMRGTRQHEVALMTDTAPARCARLLARAEVEAALVPVIEYQRIPELAVVPGVCVGWRASVRRSGCGILISPERVTKAWSMSRRLLHFIEARSICSLLRSNPTCWKISLTS